LTNLTKIKHYYLYKTLFSRNDKKYLSEMSGGAKLIDIQLVTPDKLDFELCQKRQKRQKRCLNIYYENNKLPILD